MTIHARKTQSAGFTLIELMVTVAIVGILATIAVTSYTKQVQQSRRTDARTALLDIAGREEKLFSVNNTYTATGSDIGYPNFPTNVGSNSEYQITVAYPDAVNQPGVANSYLITATAVGIQLPDTQCATLTLNQAGLQGSTGGATPATCWGN